jgi:DNA-binding CsgD family transcriptional regulator
MKYFGQQKPLLLFMYEKTLTLSIAGEKTPLYIKDIEVRILYCLLKGLYLKQIGDLENITPAAIKPHMKNLYKISKVKLHNQTALAGWIAEHNFYDLIKTQITPDYEAKITALIDKAEF